MQPIISNKGRQLLRKVIPAMLIACLNVRAETLPQLDRVRVLEEPAKISDRALTDHRGNTFRLADLNGTVALVFFGFTNCRDVCPTTMATFKRLHESGAVSGDNVSFVLISVDGERDTPVALSEFLGRFSNDFIGLTAEPAEVKKIAKEFRASFFKGGPSGDDSGYKVGHSPQAFVLDPQGRLRAEFYSPAVEAMAATINALLLEAES